MTVPALLRRGLLAGLLAGLFAGLFGLAAAEPTIGAAIRLEGEHAHAHTAGGEPAEQEVFSRGVQQFGLVVATTVTGGSLGLLFGLVYAGVYARDRRERPWRQALALAAAGFVGVFLLPFLKYPANPPAVGDPATVNQRTAAWLMAIVLGVLGVGLAWWARRRLAEQGRPEPVQHLAMAAIVVAALAGIWLLPANTDPIEVPAHLLWQFRLLSVATQLVLWGGLGAVFGLLGERALRPAPADGVA
ncbi:CbtA family protein [Carbonactinospora thermoautotrophica]|uniref:CbtA family protein n=1 Tax=Carbonactinospora thermoautotrophica TaxID=1469144 RepID=UPI00226F95AB|nr:CbtA family protein [Carbonactinospora thermoautotrophica]